MATVMAEVWMRSEARSRGPAAPGAPASRAGLGVTRSPSDHGDHFLEPPGRPGSGRPGPLQPWTLRITEYMRKISAANSAASRRWCRRGSRARTFFSFVGSWTNIGHLGVQGRASFQASAPRGQLPEVRSVSTRIISWTLAKLGQGALVGAVALDDRRMSLDSLASR